MCTWIAELMLSKIAAISNTHKIQRDHMMDEAIVRQQEQIKKEEIKILKQDFFTFVQTNNEDLDHLAIFTLLQSHGKVQECIEFAKKTGSHKELIIHYLNNKQFDKALLNLQMIEDKKVRND